MLVLLIIKDHLRYFEEDYKIFSYDKTIKK